MTGEAGRALAGRRLLVLVPEGGSRQLAEGLERNGAQVLVEALTRTEVLAPDELSAVNAWLDGNQVVDWIVLTSALGVRRLAEQASLLTVDLTARWSPPTRVAAIGPATARALVELGRTPELVAEDPRSEGLAAQLLNAGPGRLAGQTVLLIRALVGRPELIEALAATGAHVLVAPVYRTVMIQGAAERLAARLRSEVPAIDLVIVTSGAPLVALAGVMPVGERSRVRVAAIGPVTADVARDLGFAVVATGRGGSLERLIEVVIDHETTR